MYKNYFLGNTIHAIDNPIPSGWVNNWNNTIVGNYWDNHSTGDSDGDGIDDTPYDIPGTAGSKDFRPIFGNPLIPSNTVHIDGTGVSAPNWDWAVTRAWIKGSGTSEDPYIIEDLTFNAGEAAQAILIGNSSAFFIIENCTILNFTDTGIKLDKSNNGQLINNTCTSNVQFGIYLDSSNSNIISNNTINDFSFGIRLENSSYNSIIENSANGNSQVGIYLYSDSDFNNISSNIITNNRQGIEIYGSYYNDILKNEVDGSLIHGILLENGGYNSIYENTVIYNGDQGIRIWSSTFETIYNNTINNNNYGIRIINGEDCNILANEIDQNNYGLFLDQQFAGLDNNLISENLFSNCNFEGLKITTSPNLIFLNNFTGNPSIAHAIDDDQNNTWDNGTIGNYWDDYGGFDADDNGIGDTPYDITGSAKSKDNYPIWRDGDDLAPNVSIYYPIENQIFGYIAPAYNITIFDFYELNTTWYTIDEGLTNYSFSGFTGFINQTAWGKKGNETVTIKFYANDTSGHTGVAYVIIRKDIVDPVILITTPIPSQFTGGNAPTYSLSITEPNPYQVWYSLDGGITNSTPSGATSGTIDQTMWDATPNGTVTIIFYADDTAGNVGTNFVTIWKDIVDPVILITTPIPSQFTGGNAPTYSLSITEPNPYQVWYSLDGGITNSTPSGATSGTIDQTMWDATPNGTVTIIFYADDTAGNVGTNFVTIWKDIIAPNILINSPSDNEIFGITAPSFNISINEPNLDSVWYTLDNGITNITISEFTGMIDQGEWNKKGKSIVIITFYANDTSGIITLQSVSIEKYYEYWPLNSLIIDDSGGGDYTWEQAITLGWCRGSGTSIDPYLIEFIKINGQNSGSCLTIRFSQVYFSLVNCTFYNSGNINDNDAGIKLINITNGRLHLVNSSFNNGHGILLEFCEYINITNSTINNNTLNGILLIDCSYVNILDNTNTINSNSDSGIYLLRSHNNEISDNTIRYNSVGINLDESNLNLIERNNYWVMK